MAQPLALLICITTALLVSGCLGSPAPSGGNDTSPPKGPMSGAPGAGGNGSSGVNVGNSNSGQPGAGGAGGSNGTAKEVALAVSTAGQYPANPSFAPATLSAAAGSRINVTLTFADTVMQVPGGVVQHGWVLEGVDGAATGMVGPGEKSSVTFAAPKAGAYKYFCPVGDHRSKGMEGTLTVA